jgi:hypothetical protein
MAITIEGQPQNVTPAYNRNLYYLDSTNKNEAAFKYVVEVFAAGTATKLFEKRYPPRPVDGFGEADITREIQAYVDRCEPFGSTSNAVSTGSFLRYDIKFGEQYRVAWAWNDFVVGTGNTRLTDTTSSNVHPYVIGDQVQVTLNTPTGDFRDALQGLFTVVAVPDAYTIEISLPWIGSGAAVSGRVLYADGRQSRFLNLANASNKFVWNGALTARAFQSYAGTEYTLGATNRQLLTNVPDNFLMATNQDMWLRYYEGYDGAAVQLFVANSDGDTFTAALSSTANGVFRFPCGANNMIGLTVATGTAPLIKPTTQWYELHLRKAGSPVTKTYRFTIDRRCAINDTQLLFMDRLGSWVSYAMQLRQEERGDIQRQTFNKSFGALSGGIYRYNTSSQGDTTWDVKLAKSVTLRTNYLTDNMSVYFEELLTSPYAFIKIGTQYFAVTVRDSSFVTEREINKRLIRKDITVEFALKDPINI